MNLGDRSYHFVALKLSAYEIRVACVCTLSCDDVPLLRSRDNDLCLGGLFEKYR